jgi:ribosomal protein L29
MAKKKVEKSSISELESAKMEAMRIRFRKVLGEGAAPHIIKNARKNIAKCVRSLESGDGKNV